MRTHFPDTSLKSYQKDQVSQIYEKNNREIGDRVDRIMKEKRENHARHLKLLEKQLQNKTENK